LHKGKPRVGFKSASYGEKPGINGSKLSCPQHIDLLREQLRDCFNDLWGASDHDITLPMHFREEGPPAGCDEASSGEDRRSWGNIDEQAEGRYRSLKRTLLHAEVDCNTAELHHRKGEQEEPTRNASECRKT
jgi:hypothetical protein